jgi:hypothetical protein
MKKVIIFCLIIACAVTTADAARRRELSGTVEKNVYRDKEFKFSLNLNDAWKYTLQKNEDNFRLLLTQRNYDIPPDYVNSPDYTYIPRIILWTDTSSLHPFAFLDSLTSKGWNMGQKKEMMKEFEILNPIPISGGQRDEAVPRGRKPVEIGGEQGVLWQAKAKYIKEIATSASDLAGTRVYGSYGGAVVVVKRDNRMFVFHVMSEWDFFEAVLQEAFKIIGTLTFNGGLSGEMPKE